MGLDGKMVPFKLRYYQCQGIYHLLVMARMVLGDDTGLGKTAEVVGALCYLWAPDKEPHNKVIVVTPKSALRQWAAEVARFTKGVKCYVASGTPDERRAIYEQWAKAPTGPDEEKAILLVNYAILQRDWDVGAKIPRLPNGKPDPKGQPIPGLLDRITATVPNLVTVYDECFDYHTPILLESGQTELIGRIVSKRLPVRVLSWNFERGCVEAKQVTNWHRTPIMRGRGRMLNIRFRYSGCVSVTASHEFYRVDGSKTLARSLKPGSTTAHFCANIPTEDQEQVLAGGLLGDASVAYPQNPMPGVVFGHSTKQETYLRFKAEVLSSLGTSGFSRHKSEFQTDTEMVRFRVLANAAVVKRLSDWRLHDGKRKRVTKEWLDTIGSLGLAVWHGDDGALDTYTDQTGKASYRVVLHTENYTLAENELIAGWLKWRWGVQAHVKTTTKKHGAKKKTYPYLYLDAKAAERFFSCMPGALPGVEYKFPHGMPVVSAQSLDVMSRSGLIEDYVVSAVTRTYPAKKRLVTRYVYDLEVEDNHNYFANSTLVSNCHAFKNTGTKTWQTCSFLSQRSKRCYGMTATLLKNRLEEGFSVYKVIVPPLFSTRTRFLEDYCVTKLQPVPGGRKIPVVVGYRRLDQFRELIDPYFLGRAKQDVSTELPKLITREIACEMTPAEDAKYKEALSGLLELGDGETKDYSETVALTSLIYSQQVVDSLWLLKFKGGEEVTTDMFGEDTTKVKDKGSKEEALSELITEELDGEKVIVYTRFEKLVGRLQTILANEGVKSVRITGKESDKKRQANKELFQDFNSDVRVIFITDAGSESINLQSAKALIFYDAPWSWGNYAQLLGRPIRIGSIHDTVVAYHLVSERPKGKYKSRKTIDHHVLSLLTEKKGLVEKVLGSTPVGALDFGKSERGAMKDLLKTIQKAEREEKLGVSAAVVDTGM